MTMTTKPTENDVRVLFIQRENGPERLVCEAELIFGDGPLADLKLVGFCLWNGADGETYSNDCYAVAAGVGVAHEGPCEPEGAECGTLLGIPCGEGEFCEMPDDTCSSADLGGTCVAIPEVCTQHYDPVCGCDGVTYPNDCARRGALMNKAHDGACAR